MLLFVKQFILLKSLTNGKKYFQAIVIKKFEPLKFMIV